MGANSSDADLLQGLGKGKGKSLLVKQSPNEAGSVVWSDFYFEATGGGGVTGAATSAQAQTSSASGTYTLLAVISIGVHVKANGTTSPLPTAGINTTSGSTLVAFVTWATTTFTSLTDSLSNTWTQIQTEEASGTEKTRAYYCTTGSRGTGHTFTLTIGANNPLAVFIVELIPGSGYTISLDQSDRRRDTATPFTLAAGLTTTVADEALLTFLAGDSGSNPATMAETGLGSSSIQEQVTNGSTDIASAVATKIVSATGTYAPSWTQSGATNGSVWLATFKSESGVTGTATTSQAQTASASGSHTIAAVTGTATTSQAQTASASGAHAPAAVTGTATSSQAQTASASGAYSSSGVTGTGSTSQAQTSDASGSHTIAAVTGTVTTSQAQTVSGSGSHVVAAVSGTVTTSQAQTVSASGGLNVPAVSSYPLILVDGNKICLKVNNFYYMKI